MSSLARALACFLAPLPFSVQGPPLTDAGVRKLNAALPVLPTGVVAGAQLSPDGIRVFYLADNEVQNVFELESAPIDGSSPAVDLAAPLVPGGRIANFIVSPDSSFVVYRVGKDQLDDFELYRVASDASTGPAPVVSSRVATASVGGQYEISASSERIVYLADEDEDGNVGLFSVDADGASGWVELSSAPATYVSRFELSPDSARVVYASGDSSSTDQHVFVVPIAGGAPLQLSTNAGPVHQLWISPDSSRALYRTDGELYTVPLDGSQAPVRLDTVGDVGPDVQIGSDSERAVFLDAQQLRSAPLDGSAPSTLLFNAFTVAFRVDPRAERVVFNWYDFNPPGGDFLSSVPIDGSSAPVLLSNAGHSDFRFTASGERVVYKSASVDSLVRSVPTDGHAPSVLLDPGVTHAFYLAPDRDRVFFRKQDSDPDQAGLYVVNATGVESARRIADVSPNGFLLIAPKVPDVRSGRFRRASLADPSRVVFQAVRDVPSVAELFSVRQDGAAPPIKVSAPFLATEIRHDVQRFALEGPWAVYETSNHSNSESVFRVGLGAGPPAAEVEGDRAVSASIDLDSRRVVYRQLVGGRYQLFSRPLDLSAPAVQLSQADPVLGEVGVDTHVTDPLGTRVAYSVQYVADGTQALYTVPIDGSQAPVRISEALTNSSIESDFRFSPDGTRILFRESHVAGYQLFSSPSDVRDAVVLNAPLPSSGNVEAFEIGAGRVVYRADQEVNARPELYSVPFDGSASPVKLNLTPVNGVELFQLDWEGTRVVYTARPTLFSAELYVVDVLGGTSTKLSGALVPGGSVQSFRIARDGTVPARVAYLADALVNDRFELFTVPIDGSTAAVKVSGTLSPGRQVQGDYQLAGDRVAYRALFGSADLFSAPIDGSGAPSRLNAPLPTNASVDQFEITPDGQRVVYLADQTVHNKLELFLVPLRGGADPVRLNGPLVTGGDVSDFIRFQLTSDSRGVVYCANQELPGTFELYLATFPRPVASASFSGN